MTLRIAIALHDFSLGGTERIAIRLANQWAAAGAEVLILAGSEQGAIRGLLNEHVGLVVAKPPIARAPRSVARLGRWVRSQLGQASVDLLFVPGNYHWPIASALRGMTKELRPLVVAQVSNVLRKPQRGMLQQYWFEVRIRHRLRAVDAIVTMSANDCRLACHILRRSDCLTIELPALDPGPLHPTPVDSNSRLIVSAGRFVKQKAFEVLIDAFAIVAGQDENARLLLLGEGPEREMLQQRLDRLGLTSRVQMPGFVEDIRPYLEPARLFVLSSRFEGYGAVIIEALSTGRPVVSTASTPAVTELLSTPGAGLVVPIEDAEALARAIITEMNGPAPDVAVLAASVETYRIDLVARRYEQLFDDLVKRRDCLLKS